MDVENTDKEKIASQIKDLESQMSDPDFWQDKARAKDVIKQINQLKDQLKGVEKYDKGNAVMSVVSGAGGEDAEDFAFMLFEMYAKFFEHHNFSYQVLHKHENQHGGLKNITFEVVGNGAYGLLKKESGVHRLVRVSPFNAKKQRHTSFALVEVMPELEKLEDVEIPDKDIRFEFSKSGGPGGQNVNKRETAVRVIHIPSNTSAHIDSERTQEKNKAKALRVLHAKLFKILEDQKKQKKEELSLTQGSEIKWGNQIRSYVLHPYKLVKDHRTDVEVRDVEKVFDGHIQDFLEPFND